MNARHLEGPREDLISVVMPAFNAAPYIGAAIKSILDQSYRNIELIIINDGSSDSTNEVIQEYVVRDQRITYVSRENRGVAHTRNEAVALARGDWIALMDADDISHPERLREQWQYIHSNHLDACSTWIELFGFGGRRVKSYSILRNEISLEALFGCPIAHATLLARRDIFERFPYITAWENAEDYEFLERAISGNINIQCLAKILYFYRQHPRQTSSAASKKQQVLSQRISLRRWQDLGVTIGLTSEEIEAVVSLRSVESQRLNLNSAERAFLQLLKKYPNQKGLIFTNLLPLYFRAAYQYGDIAKRWQRMCKSHNFPVSKAALLQLYCVSKLKISPQDALFKKLQDCYLWASSKLKV